MNKDVIKFISSGICCNSIVLINSLGLLNPEVTKKGIHLNNFLKKYDQPKSILAIKAAFLSLEKMEIFKQIKNRYYLTELGKKIIEQIGLIKLLFEGYGKLIAQQPEIGSGEITETNKLLNGAAIAESSIQFSEKDIIPKVVKEMLKRKIKGTLCDFGCGSATHLINICEELKINGLGIDIDRKAVAIAKQNTKNNPNIKIIHSDITKYNKSHPDIEVIMQCHVMHDINPASYCIEIMNATLRLFPNLKYFFYIDIVSPSSELESYMPGFDYIHGLQGIQTRNYEETIRMFKKSKFQIEKEIPIKSMPNTFFWILSPK